MAMVRCRECDEKISDKAKACPNCGSPVHKKSKGNTALVIFLAVVAGYYFVGEPSESTDQAEGENQSTDEQSGSDWSNYSDAERSNQASSWAQYHCKQLLSESLHDPRSAQWEPSYEWPTVVRENSVVVTASLRASNGFGALVFSRYRCELEYDEKNWRVKSLEPL